ncbi:phosphotyrosine protein phosphatase [Erythrobacter sp. QSSC1-22B]|uniref:low molecular weight protein-tyrosine-phosphatase n=1 Tax=Erythrobacter sp. QSSC1-22B TaxID=1860125 RepID=UPI000804E282|nr:low molecular weight protein-tyrosine-phosphatase [Erythrobacter sp. QSSC1-22B]OBX20613.1 phosphotyrosine protein phosphatase [Erythrobacter sp. QSSC1-22B]
MTTPSILFVCLGNICRSPLAEAALRHRAAAASLELKIDSVGTAGYHVGEPPDPRAIAEARRQGIEIGAYCGRQLSREDFARFDHILVMDEDNLADVRAIAPAESTAKIGLLLDVVPGTSGRSVADPYHGSESDFAATWKEVDAAAEALVAVLLSEQRS